MSDPVISDQSNFQEAMQAFYQGAGVEAPPASAEVTPETPAEQVAPETPSVDVVEAKATEPVAADPAVTEVAPVEPVKVPESPDLVKLMAREAALQSREEKFKAVEADITAVYNHMQEFEAAKAQFAKDPVGFIRMMNPDVTLASVAERLYYEEIGDKAPLEYQVDKKTAVVERRLDSVEKRLEERERAIAAREQEQAVHAYRSNLAAQAKSLDEKSYPLLTGLAKRNATRFDELLFAEAQKVARATNGEKVLTHEEAAQAVEKFLAKERHELFGDAPTAVKEQPKPPSGQVTTWNNTTAVQPSLKPADPDDDKVLRKAALEAAGLGHLPVW